MEKLRVLTLPGPIRPSREDLAWAFRPFRPPPRVTIYVGDRDFVTDSLKVYVEFPDGWHDFDFTHAYSWAELADVYDNNVVMDDLTNRLYHHIRSCRWTPESHIYLGEN